MYKNGQSNHCDELIINAFIIKKKGNNALLFCFVFFK